MTNTTEPAGDQLRAVVEDYGTPAPKDVPFTAEEQAIAAEIVAMDPHTDTGPHSGLEGRKLSAPTLQTLSPAMRQQAQARLAGIPLDRLTPELEAEAVMAVYREHLPDIRVMTGLSSDATPYHREMANIAANHRDLAREFDRITKELAEVSRYRSVSDPATGEQKPEPVLAIQGTQRLARIDRLAELNHAMKMLHLEDGSLGPEAKRRMNAALRESVAARLTLKHAAEDKAEVERRAAAMVREERIAEQAASRARLLRGTR